MATRLLSRLTSAPPPGSSRSGRDNDSDTKRHPAGGGPTPPPGPLRRRTGAPLSSESDSNAAFCCWLGSVRIARPVPLPAVTRGGETAASVARDVTAPVTRRSGARLSPTNDPDPTPERRVARRRSLGPAAAAEVSLGTHHSGAVSHVGLLGSRPGPRVRRRVRGGTGRLGCASRLLQT